MKLRVDKKMPSYPDDIILDDDNKLFNEALRCRPELEKFPYNKDNHFDRLFIRCYHIFILHIESINNRFHSHTSLECYIGARRHWLEDFIRRYHLEHLSNLIKLFTEKTDVILAQHANSRCCIIQ